VLSRKDKRVHKFIKTRVAALAAAVLGLAMLVIPAAHANPEGCLVTSSMSVANNGQLTAYAEGNCVTSETRTVAAEVKWDKALSTDPLVARSSRQSTGKRHWASVTTCDYGRRRGYYARGYFTTNTSYKDTSPRDATAC
jgi:hypothetical protein